MTNKIWYLKQVHIFRDMPEDFTHRLHAITDSAEFGTREVIFTPAEAREKVYILKRGEVRIFRFAGDRKVVVDTLRRGDIFGDVVEDSGTAPDNYAESVGATYLCVASKAEFFSTLRSWPDVALRLLSKFGQRISDAEGKIRDLAGLNVTLRLLNELVRHAREEGVPAPDGYLAASHRITHQQLAESIGASRETVTKSLAALKQQGYVRENPDGQFAFDTFKISDVV